ncbi:hypothetical protein YA28_20615 [Klebsiella aerogenes]|nr:hypothetical protein YA28_20615 [Klebsiella aerogenes]KUQ14003.1 hypothetical protein AWI09_21540 [Klebsiella aerogenes]KUR08769.1 hypothetical protein AWI35_21080 [Klebsiella aerogenes]
MHQIEIRLVAIEHVAIILSRLLIPAPDALFDTGKHWRIVLFGRRIGPEIILPERRMPVFTPLLKPGMLRRVMLDNQLDDYAYPQFARVINQSNNVANLPKTRIGLQMILHIVTVIEKWGQIKGG